MKWLDLISTRTELRIHTAGARPSVPSFIPPFPTRKINKCPNVLSKQLASYHLNWEERTWWKIRAWAVLCRRDSTLREVRWALPPQQGSPCRGSQRSLFQPRPIWWHAAARCHHSDTPAPQCWNSRSDPGGKAHNSREKTKVVEDCQKHWHLHWLTFKIDCRKPHFSEDQGNHTAEPSATCRVSTNKPTDLKQQGIQTAQAAKRSPLSPHQRGSGWFHWAVKPTYFHSSCRLLVSVEPGLSVHRNMQ